MKNFPGPLHQAAVLMLLCASLTTLARPALAQQGTFVPTGNLITARNLHTATLLNNGKVLIAGGSDNTSFLTSAELYDPATGTFTVTGSLNTARFAHTATLLSSGKVLIAGGDNTAGYLASAELYDPATGMFTPTNNMNTVRSSATATLLNNGMVLIVGGNLCGSFCQLTNAELYDPAAGVFTPSGTMNTPRALNTATLLNNGMVLIAGGEGGIGNYLASAELYDPATGVFTPAGNMSTPRFEGTATLLNNGKVLIAGGLASSSSLTASVELYDPATGVFTPAGNMSTPRFEGTATLLNNGKVLIVGGNNPALASAEFYDPATGTFTPTSSLNTARMGYTATLLNNGTLLIAAGWNGGVLSSAELYELVVVSPTSLSFSNQVTGTTSASQAVILTNNQSSALNITSIVFSGTNASDFAETDNCVGSVAVGASCSINVTFTPAAVGNRTGSLNIANNFSGNPLPVPLTGTGVTATQIVSLSTNSLTFPNQIVSSTSPAQGITLTNTGNSTLAISGLAISGANASEFAETDNCVGSVAAGATCSINVTFSPAATGTRTGTLSITDNATSPPSPQTVALTGTATAPLVSVVPSSITFPAQFVGTSGLPQSVTVTNNGNAPLSISSVTPSPADFGVLNTCGSSLAAGARCAIGVFFDPTASGTRPGTLTINDNAPGSPHTVALSGTGQDFSLAPSGQATATVTRGQTANYTLAVMPGGGFNQTVTLSCSGAPADSTCLALPNPLVLNGSAAGSIAVTVTTMASSLATPTPSVPLSYQPLLYLVTELLVLSLLCAFLKLRTGRHPRLAYGLALLLVLCAGAMLSGCGGGSSSGGGGNPGTPTGSYTIVVSGTFTSGSTSLTHNVNLNLVVQ